MRNKTTLSLLVLTTFALIGVFYITSNINKMRASKSNQISFVADLIDSPRRDEETGQYFIFFDNVKAFNKVNKKDLASLNQGGILVTDVPADTPIEKKTKVIVTLKRNFATTNSLPPQILGHGVVSVKFR
ncbi:hypothetical protein OGZ37_06650 [Lactococcus lactis]|uniref:hypothetical protein n=1 Tax=Lactococcus lactis TaxID=1358 RepID=UPI002418234A|nr:hypothetical protein [Lactococcus lactis]MDG4966255.1 hypothetical protein [Lactococcus lactis]